MANTSGIRAGRAYVELGVSDKLDAGLRAAQARFKAFGSAVKAIGQDLLKVSLGMAAPFALATKAGADFEQAMARVKALSGAGAEDMAKLEGAAREMGKSTVYSATEAAQAMALFAQAGYDTDKIMAALGPTLNLAAAAGMTIADAAEVSTVIMSGMGIEAGKLGHAIDLLSRAESSSVTNLYELGDAMKYVGPVSNLAGLSMEQIVAAIEVLSNAGIKGEMAGTTLRGAILSLTDPSEKAATELARLGISIKDADGNFRPLADIIQQFERALKGLGSADRLAVIGKIFDARQASGFAKLVERGSAELRYFEADLANAGGTAGRIAGVQMNTLTGSFKLLINTAKDLGIEIEKALGPPLRVAVVSVSRLVGRITEFVKTHQNLVLGLAIGTAAVAGLGAAFLGLGMAMKAVGVAFGVLQVSFAIATTIVGSAASALFGLVSPIGVVIAVVGLLGAHWVAQSGIVGKAVGWIQDKIAGLGGVMTEVVTVMRNALSNGQTEAAANVMWAGLKYAWQEGAYALKMAWLSVKTFMLKTASEIWYGILATAEIARHGLVSGWIETVSSLSTAWQGFANYVELSWETIKAAAMKAWNYIKSLASDEFDVQAANAAVDIALVAAEERINAQKSSALDEIEKRRQSEAASHQNNMAEIGRADKASIDALNAEYQGAVGAARGQLDDARAALRKALDDAKAMQNEGQAGAKGKDGIRGPDMGALPAIADEVSTKFQTVGTFNAAAVAGLGSGSTADRIANATEKTARLSETQIRIMSEIGQQMFAGMAGKFI